MYQSDFYRFDCNALYYITKKSKAKGQRGLQVFSAVLHLGTISVKIIIQ